MKEFFDSSFRKEDTMIRDSKNHLNGIFPEILYVIDRNASPSWRLNGHMNNYNLMLIYGGKAEFTHDTITFQASRGYLVFYKPGVLRKAYTFPDNLMKCFAIDFQYTCPVFINNEWQLINQDLPFSCLEKIEDEYLFLKLLDLFSQLTKSAISGKNHNKVKERSIFTEILTLLFQYKEGNQYNYSNIKKVNKIINYMADNYQNNINLQELADYSQISSSYLGNIFKKVTGKSPIDYLIEIRINKAKTMLNDGFTVSETARLAGFHDIYYFSRAFKKQEGISPSKYMAIMKTEF